MDDEIKKAGLLKLICPDCLESRQYRIEHGNDELWYCPHRKVMTSWLADVKAHGFTLFNVTDEEFFVTLSRAREGWDELQSGLN